MSTTKTQTKRRKLFGTAHDPSTIENSKPGNAKQMKQAITIENRKSLEKTHTAPTCSHSHLLLLACNGAYTLGHSNPAILPRSTTIIKGKRAF
jgi:hypothetical protein